jgi:hypothetical protein
MPTSLPLAPDTVQVLVTFFWSVSTTAMVSSPTRAATVSAWTVPASAVVASSAAARVKRFIFVSSGVRAGPEAGSPTHEGQPPGYPAGIGADARSRDFF